MKKNVSLTRKLLLIILIVILPLFILLIGNSMNSLSQIRSNIVKTNKNALAFYTAQLDDIFNDVTKHILYIETSMVSAHKLDVDDDNERFLATSDVLLNMSNQLLVDPVDYFFVYAKSNNELSHIYRTNTVSPSDAMFYKQYIYENINVLPTNSWTFITINNQDFIYFTYNSSNSMLGAMIRIDKLLMDISSIEQSTHDYYFVTDKNGNMSDQNKILESNEILLTANKVDYYMTGSKNSYISIYQPSFEHNYMLWKVIEAKNPVNLLDRTQLIILLASIVLLLMIPTTIYLIYRWILLPLNKLHDAITEIKKGRLDYMIKQDTNIIEFVDLSKAFNEMTTEIKHLKIKVYEEALEKQQAQLNFLQMQIRPHFYLNALTTIINYSRLQNWDNLEKFILYFSDYIRYMFHENTATVSVLEEIKHLENYINIHNLQQNNNILFLYNVDLNLETFPIPAFLLFTLIENSVKHGLMNDKTLSIFINIHNYSETIIEIIVEDDGNGFPALWLDLLNKDSYLKSNRHKHIGLRNLYRTLNLIYKEDTTIKFENSELCGSKTIIHIQRQKNTGEEHINEHFIS